MEAKEPMGQGETWAKAGRELEGGLRRWVRDVLSLACCKPEFMLLLPVFFFLHQALKGFAISFQLKNMEEEEAEAELRESSAATQLLSAQMFPG